MTASQRMYLTSIYKLSKTSKRVLSVDVANRLDVSRASVCKAMKRLAEDGYVAEDYQSHIRLTSLGKKNAQQILHQESIVMRFLQKTLALSSEQASEYAATMTHLLQEDTLARMEHQCERLKTA